MRRRTAYHEAGHAVASHFLPLCGGAGAVSLARADLAAYNAGKPRISHASGLHSRGRQLPATSRNGIIVDREQLEHEVVMLLAGAAADFLLGGARRSPSRKRVERDAALLKAAGHVPDGDFSRAWSILCDLHPLDPDAAMGDLTPAERQSASARENRARRAVADYHERIILAELAAVSADALDLVAAKWPHVQAVGDELLRRGRLSAAEVREIIQRTDERLSGPLPWIAWIAGDLGERSVDPAEKIQGASC
jgi:hypothetical protein